jgi:hypothetical protein
MADCALALRLLNSESSGRFRVAEVDDGTFHALTVDCELDTHGLAPEIFEPVRRQLSDANFARLDRENLALECYPMDEVRERPASPWGQ